MGNDLWAFERKQTVEEGFELVRRSHQQQLPLLNSSLSLNFQNPCHSLRSYNSKRKSRPVIAKNVFPFQL